MNTIDRAIKSQQRSSKTDVKKKSIGSSNFSLQPDSARENNVSDYKEAAILSNHYKKHGGGPNSDATRKMVGVDDSVSFTSDVNKQKMQVQS